jgi:tungstate transport system substrate-binding protein
MRPDLRRHRRRLSVLVAAALALALPAALLPAVAQDDSSTLTVVGTSDVFDSNLVQTVLKPGFEAAFPQYHLNYVSKGTGAAIDYAEAGTASALIVHAASLENQFVAQGYSYEQYGRAIFWGDYVLLGPSGDPAGVLANAPHDIVGAFQRIAAAGAAGTANVVARSGTPGTAVQEHAIWALTSGVTTCTLSVANGGGASPSTTTGDCPSSISYPSWYHPTGLTQGPNIINADACNYPGGNCYVLTDRGTFNYLQATGAVSNLKVVTRDNAPTATGGGSLLVNSFHAYALNPAKFVTNPNVAINLPAATAFLNWVTSPVAQAAIGRYLSAGGDPPFIPDAAPALTKTPLPATVQGGKTFTVAGTLSNVVPGTPPLSGVRVSLQRVQKTASGQQERIIVDGATTDASGHYYLTYKPLRSQAYWLTVGATAKVEAANLSPVFGDLLAPTSRWLGRVSVVGNPRIRHVSTDNGGLRLRGRLRPYVLGTDAKVVLWAVPRDKIKAMGLHRIASRHIRAGATHFDVRFNLRPGDWTFKLRYVNTGRIKAGYTDRRTVTVP